MPGWPDCTPSPKPCAGQKHVDVSTGLGSTGPCRACKELAGGPAVLEPSCRALKLERLVGALGCWGVPEEPPFICPLNRPAPASLGASRGQSAARGPRGARGERCQVGGEASPSDERAGESWSRWSSEAEDAKEEEPESEDAHDMAAIMSCSEEEDESARESASASWGESSPPLGPVMLLLASARTLEEAAAGFSGVRTPLHLPSVCS